MKQTVKLHLLENRGTPEFVTFGVPFKKGQVKEEDSVICIGDDNKKHEIQKWTTAYWQDGSVKWGGYTVEARDIKESITLEFEENAINKQNGNSQQNSELKNISTKNNIQGNQLSSARLDNANLSDNKSGNGLSISVLDKDDRFVVDTGVLKVDVLKAGDKILQNGFYNENKIIQDAGLVYVNETIENEGLAQSTKSCVAKGIINSAIIERMGELECVIKLDGKHCSQNGEFDGIPFILRLTFHKDSKKIDITHTFFYDGDKNTQFMKGIGVEVRFVNSGEGYNRHIKLAGDYGMFHEVMVGLKSFKPKIPDRCYKNQYEGNFIENYDEDIKAVKAAIGNIPYWDTYKISQLSPLSYEIRKSMAKKGCCSICAGFGKRAQGLVYAGSRAGGISVSMRDFWQKFPSSLWIEGMRNDIAKITAWIWSPESNACDFRHYDDEGHANGTYEGFNEVKSDPVGIANTNELSIELYESGIVSDDTLLEVSKRVQKPALFVATPEYYHEVKAFGEWSLVRRDTPLRTWLEDELDRAIDFYLKEPDKQNWYGLFNYGDVMHTYDAYRHMWQYDMGGRAWQNTELVPTYWLWYTFMRTGREDVYSMIEAMSRHASEVDMYHFGIYKGIGSRHNVIHWGDSCKEPRIGMAGHHRPFYYLRGGELRMGDVLTDTKDADFATLNIDPLRHFFDKDKMVYKTHARTGPDWTAFVSNWFTQWERMKDEKYKDKIMTGLNDIFNSPLGLVSGPEFEYDPETGHLRYLEDVPNCISHMSVSMGGPQTLIELNLSLESEELAKQMAIYGSYYFLPLEEKQKKAKGLYGNVNCVYPYMGTTMASFAARYYNDKHLAYQVWQVLVHSLAGKDKSEGFDSNKVDMTYNAKNLTEMFWISTNFTSQWCLNTIVALELTKDMMPETKEEIKWEDWVK
jgi:hypothetical protein